MSRLEPLNPPVQFGKYQLTERIALGRMGEVFRAKRDGVEGFEKILVVKRLFPQLSANQRFVDGFVEEAKLTVSLSHANIVQVLDLGHQDNAYFMAMEYVPGYDLGTVQRILHAIGKPFPLDIAVFIVSEVAKGLDYAHRRKDYNFESLNIVHRDLTPANVLISFEGEVKISDFGISRALEVLGQPQDVRRQFLYCSPEQARGQHMTHQSDIFSLGLMLYELACGQHPYHDAEPRVVQQNAAAANITPIGRVADIPRALQQIVDSTLAVDVAQRVDSAGTLYEELISYLFASGQKADNRTLSLFMQDLRPHEAQALRDGYRPGLDSSAMEIQLDDIEEIRSASSSAVPRPNMNQPAAAPRGGTLDRMAGVDGHSSQPGRHVDLGSNVPPRLGQLIGGLSSGQGGAVCVVGDIGSGPDRLTDRLPALIRTVGANVVSMVATPDDETSPYAFASVLIRSAVGLPDARSLNVAQPGYDQSVDALDRLFDLGLNPAEHQMAVSICGMMESFRKGFHEKRELALALCDKIVDRLGQSGCVVVVSGAEHLDPLSADLLVHMAYRSRQTPVAIVLATETGTDVRTFPIWSAHPDALEVAAATGRSAPGEPESMLRGAQGVAREVLTALALAGRPLSPALLEALLGKPVTSAIKALQERNTVCVAEPDHVYLGLPGLRSILDDELAVGALPRSAELANALLGYVQRASRGDLRQISWASTALRLLAWLGQRDQARDLALGYGRTIEAASYNEIALEWYTTARSVFGGTDLGDPQSEIDFGLAQFRIALGLMQLELANGAVQGARHRARELADERRFYQVTLAEGHLAMLRDDASGAWANFRAALEGGERLHFAPLVSQAHLALARWHSLYGDLRGASRHLESVLSVEALGPSRDGAAQMRLHALRMMVDVLSQRGQVGLATQYQARLEQLAAHLATAQASALVLLGRSHLSRASGSPGQGASEAETGYNQAREHNLVSLGLLLALEVAEASLDAGDLQRTRAYGEHLNELGVRYGHYYVARRGHDLSRLSGVLAPGAKALDSLQGLHEALKRAQESQAPREQLQAHILLFRALNHLGSGSDADHHRNEAQRYAQLCGADGTAAQLTNI